MRAAIADPEMTRPSTGPPVPCSSFAVLSVISVGSVISVCLLNTSAPPAGSSSFLRRPGPVSLPIPGRRAGGTAAYTVPMSIYESTVHRLDGSPASLADYRGKTLLVVNVASKCGLTPQYTGLEELQKKYEDRGFSVLGFPCNQFGGQEPGTADEIATFCSATYGVSFPVFEKVDVNGSHRHPVYEELTAFPDAEGEAGDIQWNFEKFLISPTGEVVQRFRPTVEPESPEVIDAVEANLPS